ncbi:MAG: ABC-F family ATP-binding cassette domain-containing protein [Planctomycetota bacterium]
MTLVTLERVVKTFGGEPVLDGLSLRVDEGDRIGVVGDNGSGKTTMARILAGLDEPDSGQRNARKDLRVAFGEQMPRMAPDDSVLSFVLRGNGRHEELERRIRELEQALASDPHDRQALAEYDRLHAAFESGGGYRRPHEVERVLEGLGFSEEARGRRTAVLSGGERSRAQLALLMTTPADLLILDEPTNHLDLEGIEFVEDFVRGYPGAVVVISHDRRFLDRAVSSIAEIANGAATRYRGNYSDYAAQRDLALLGAARQYKSQREFVEKEMDYIRRNMAGRNSAQARGRLKRLQRLQLIEKPRQTRRALRLSFSGGKGLAGQTVLEAENLGIRVAGDRWLLRGASLRVYFGETLAVLGRNGCGKTSLLRVLADLSRPSEGELKRARDLRVGYFAQDRIDLPARGTVLEALAELDRTVEEKELRDHLALFLFCGDDVEKPVQELSGGERQRLALARLVRSDFDLLCMDEPTNHLDVAGTEGLEQALKEFRGTIVLVSHDRQLVEQVADRVAWIEGGSIRTFDQGLEQCQRILAEERSARRERESAARERDRKPLDPPPRAIETGRIRNPILFEKLEQRIIALEERIESIRNAMMLPENYSSVAAARELQLEEERLKGELAAAYEEWENWR